MRLLFLDFDGVLNDDAYFASPAFLARTAGLSDAEVMLIDRREHLDPTKVALLNRIVEATGAAVVVSSTWRLAHTLEELEHMLRDRGGTFALAAVTPRVTEHDPTRPLRAREILAYLAQLPAPPSHVAALDDDDLRGLVPGHVRTDGRKGLGPDEVAAVLRLLEA